MLAAGTNFCVFLSHFLILLTCILNLTKPCAYLIKISLFQPKIFKRKSNNRKIAIILDRVSGGGRRDIEITNKFSKQVPNIFFLRRSIVKMIFYYFDDKSNLLTKLIDVSKLNNRMKYFGLPLNKRNKNMHN